MMLMLFCFVIFFIKAYVVWTHLNCLVEAIQMRPNICFYKDGDKCTWAII